jgi:phage terminase small subunit
MTKGKISRASDLIVLDEDLSPALRELTEPQRAFVLAYAQQGGENAAEAARRAGYGNTNADQANIASKLLRSPRILAGLREVADHRLKSGAILAASVLVQIAQDPMNKNQYKAATDLLNRAGLVVESVSRMIVEDHRTPEEIERRIRDLAERLGVDPDKLIGQSTVVDVTDYEDLEDNVERIRDEGDEWQAAQKEFDAMLERSE